MLKIMGLLSRRCVLQWLASEEVQMAPFQDRTGKSAVTPMFTLGTFITMCCFSGIYDFHCSEQNTPLPQFKHLHWLQKQYYL